MRTIDLKSYSDQWPKLYKIEAEKIRKLLHKNYMASYHIGSTAIKGMISKSTIDILIEVRNIEEIDFVLKDFKGLGYISEGEYGIKGRRFFHKGGDKRTHHIHIFETGNPEIQRHRDFVEFLSCRPVWAEKYRRLKIALADKYKSLPNEYSEGKREFIEKVDREAKKWKAANNGNK